MKFVVTLATMLLWVAFLAAVNWTGATSINWDTGSNWSSGTVPTLTTDVVIPAGTTRSPQVIWATGNCRDLILQSGATLTISGSYTLNVRHMTMHGNLVMNSGGPIVSTGNISWESGSTASIGSLNPRINLQGNMTFQSGSNIQMTYGIIQFNGSTSANLINYSSATQMPAVEAYKTYPASLTISSATTQPFTLNSNIYNYTGSTMINNYAGTITVKGSITDNNLSSDNGKINFNSGTVMMDGANPSISLKNPNCFLQNITFSQTGTASLSYPLTVKGKLRIESGVFSPQTHNITIAGNWENIVGPSAFTEGSARVVFNGTAHQYCNSTETFNILEVNKSGGSLRVNGSTTVVTCAQYDWTAGGIEVINGTFTASDLADTGIFGSYWVNIDGIINLTNNDSWVDLNGSMTFNYGGTINVYGGTGTSDWSYGGNASLTMYEGGTLDFKDVGINIYNSPTYTFTYSIISDFFVVPDIRTVGSFTCNRSSFAPEQGYVVMYGATDATLTMNAGSLSSLRIDKAATREEDSAPQPTYFGDDRSGEPRDVSRANTVNLATNVVVTNTFDIRDGVCNLQSYQLSCSSATTSGTLRMNNSSAKLFATNGISWWGSNYDITLGTLETTGNWTVYTPANLILPIAVVTNLIGTSTSSIDIRGSTMQFGTLNIGGTATTGGVYTLTGSQNLFVAGNLTITAGNELDMGSRNLTVNGALNLNGKLDINATTATVQGKPIFATTSNLSIVDGSFTFYDSSIPRDTTLRGVLNLENSTFNAVNNALIINAGSTNTVLGSSEIICDAINAINAGTFQPAAGTVKLNSNLSASTHTINVSNGNWLPNVIIETNTGFALASNLIIKGDLTIQAGILDVSASNYSITISGNWQNQVGINAFVERSGRVMFNGSGNHQQCNYSETFSILEINKLGGYFWMNSPSTVVTCASYDWSAGGISISQGTFTANDLADNGIMGTFVVINNAIINLTNNDGYVDLNGDVNISGEGTLNVYGGTTTSDWSYGGNAVLSMSGGTLDFKNRGIRIFNSPTYTFSSNITGGTIRTVGGLEINRAGFNPTGGTLELYGSTDASLSMSYGYLHHIIINKAASREEETLPQTALIAIDKEGNPSELTRSNTLNLGGNIDIRGNLSIESGVLNPQSNTISIAGDWNNLVGIAAFTEGSSRVIFNGTADQYCNYSETFNILEVNKASGNFCMNSSSAVVTCAQYDWTAGGIKIIAGTFTANDLADLGIYGFISAENAATINLTNNDSYVDLNGSLAISGSSTVNIYGGTTQSDWSLRANASLTMSGGTLDFKNQGIQIINSPTYTFSSNITGGTIRTVGGFQANRTGFNPTGGILELYGSTDASLAMSYGSLYDLYINKAASREEENLPQAPLMAMDKEGNTRELTRSNTINLGSTIYINRDLIIQNGVFNASTQTINIGRDWNNQVGDAGFTQGQSTVIFDGLGTQYIYSDEVFWNFTLQKSGATSSLWQVDGTEVQVANTMNLISGYYRSGSDGDTYVKNLNIQSLACFSSLSELHVAGDMYDYNTTYGESVGYVQQGVLVFDGDTDQTISRSGTEIRANSLIIYKSSSTRCYFEKPVTLSNSLSIQSGIWQDMGNGFVHKVGGVVNVYGTGSIANDTNNTFSFVGNMAQTIAYYSSSMGFTNIVIDKSDSGRIVDSESKDGNRSVDVTMIFHLNLANSGNFTVENGNFYTNGLNLTCPGNININSSNAALYIMPGSTVRLGNTKSLNVNAGLLDISGSTTRTTTITSISGFYNFNVESGANLSAIYTIFEKMTANGVNVKTGALVNTTDPFKNCTFQNGASGGTLLTLNSNQTLNIDNAVFPANTWSGTNNVKKTLNQGTVNFNMASGAFSGAAFESDTNNRINWLGGTPDLLITSIDWSSNSPYICDPVTATVHVQNNSTTNITTAFRVDLYKNRSTAPPAGLLGDSYSTISSLAAGATTTVTFTNISTDIPGSWTSWFQVDANGLITETNESNNVWTPAISTTWNELPVAQNLQVVRSGNNVSLSWTYPISVYRYKIYKDTNPYGSFSTLAGTSATPSFTQAIYGTQWFYRIRAERLLP